MNTPSAIPQSSIQGSIFELVARGRKDTYFVNEKDSSVLPFNGRYDSSVPFIQERRTTVPLNQTRFGSTFDVEIDRFGDVITECNLLIDLPTWLPPLPTGGGGSLIQENGPSDPIEANSLYWIKDASGFSYGYTQYVGYFLFESIQFYQDQFLLQEWSGDLLFATTASEGSWNSSYLAAQQLAGVDVAPGSARSIAYRATPGRLRLALPIPGIQTPGDGGFPIGCMPRQAYRFRIKLRALEDLVESDNLVPKPAPWAPGTVFSYTPDGSSVPYTFSPVPLSSIGQPTILLETRQAYLSDDIREEFHNNRQSIPFRRPFENVFTFGPNDYKPLDTGGTATVTRRLDARHPVERIVFFFRTANATDRNRLSDVVDPSGADYGEFYNKMKLVIAGRDREEEYGPLVWHSIESYAKDEIDSGYNIGEMRWNLGDVYERVRPYGRVPEGTVNFTTADRPTLHINLNNVPPQAISGLRKSEFRVFMEGWNAFIVEEGRGRLLFAN